MTDKTRLVLVDGSSYLFRAFFALPPLTNSHGMPTGAIYGVVNMMKKLIATQHPDHIAMVFDAKGKTFRHEFDPNYKANRETMPEDLSVQIPYLHAIIEAMGIPLIAKEGVEADDIIGTLSKQAADIEWEVLISTSDKDMAQLVNDHTTLVNTMTNKSLDCDGVFEKFGVRPDQIIDYLALMGDTSDNIPGVPKVGPKTAAKWLSQYETLDAIIERADEFTGKVGEYLRGHLEQLPKNRFLTTIKLDVELPIDVHTLMPKPADKEALSELYEVCEFKRWRQEVGEVAMTNGKPIVAPLPDEPDHAPRSLSVTHTVITDENALAELCQQIKQAECVGFHLERNEHNTCIGLALALDDDNAIYIPVTHDASQAPTQIPIAAVIKHLNDALDSECVLVGQSLKDNLNCLCAHGLTEPKHLFDNGLAAYLLNKNNQRLDFNALCTTHLDHQPIALEEIIGSGKKKIAFNQVAIEDAARYLTEAAALGRQLYHLLKKTLANEPTLDSIFSDIDMPLLCTLMRMESHGVLIDTEALHEQSAAHEKRLGELELEAIELAGTEFNLSSPKQLREILFDSMGLPVIKKTPGGDPSTSEEVLRTLALNYPLPKVIMEHRKLSKLKSTYTDKLPEIADSEHRVHTTYHQTATTTGRLSSTSPNLQNIPIKTKQGRDIRRAFIAPSGYKIVAADYSQVELRIMAHLSEDPQLLKAFSQGDDIHRATASDIFDTPLDKVTSEQRRHAKAVNFGLLYGMSSFGLAKQLGISRGEAAHYIDTYFERFPTVQRTLDNIRVQAAETGYVETCFGRRVYLPDITAKNAIRRKAAERAAINAPMQGSAADIIKKAMLSLDAWIQQDVPDIHLIMQVHDELVFEVPNDKVDMACQVIRDHMMNVSPLSVPLIVDIGVGDHWEDAH